MATIDLVVLNYNGRHLLDECLPSLVRASRASRHLCRVAVIDNASTDGSVDFLDGCYPQVRQFHCANRGLCSFNEVLPQLDSSVVTLLNNDIKLASQAIDPLVEPLIAGSRADPKCFLTTPLCWLFDGRSYEGLQTALNWRWGLVQARSDYPGHEQVMYTACLTASAGAVMAVDRDKFLEVGGFDPLYLPGRIEDLDFCFRGYQAGYHARYVPAAVAYHKGEATFRRELGADRSQSLALRNTLLFQWKNLRHPWHVVRLLAALPVRFAADLVKAPFVRQPRRLIFTKAVLHAIHRWYQCRSAATSSRSWRDERALMRRLHWRRFVDGAPSSSVTWTSRLRASCNGC
ncbi:MAG TPA: glycosyltransferase family 2 protein [Pirellulales bacterium]|nr:glycosyltransferase family 2 protein [Pirellulales bacterium]